jgi:cytosine/adenosine deaminase-related metal-dependent hydrolase
MPILNVSDVAVSIAWLEMLGLECGFTWPGGGDDPDFAGLTSSDAELFLCRDGQGARGRGAAFPGDGSTGGVWMSWWLASPASSTCATRTATPSGSAHLSTTRGSTTRQWAVEQPLYGAPAVATLYENGWIVTMDDAGSELPDGWVLVEDAVISAVGSGEPPQADKRVDLSGAVVTPGLVNTHHHLYQTLTRARAQQAGLFEWLRELYPIWSQIDAEAEYAAARTGLAELALSGCTTVFDHHYVFPRGCEGLIEAEVQAARDLGVRIVASRGSMDLGVSDGGLPPDELVEELDDVLAETERLARALHETGPGARVQIAVAPCSPFSVTGRLMEESAAAARSMGLPLHTHLAETVEEDAYCHELYGCTPVEYLERLGWLANDVWCAHCVHLSPENIATFAATGTGVAHCPTSNLRLGAGVAPVPELVAAGARVGLGVDGSASNERSDLFFEVKQALLVARGRSGGDAMTVRDALRLGTRGGAAVLQRDDIGSLEPGKQADLAVWRTDGLELGGAQDAVAGLVFSAPHRVDRLVVGGEDVVRGGALVQADESEIARAHRVQTRRFAT